MNIKLIAPCGMNCGICMGYLRERNKCPGCRLQPLGSCRKCRIRLCAQTDKRKYCFTCNKYPCERLTHLDNRYRTKYGMSMTNNLVYIKRKGIDAFIRKEKKKWQNSKGTFCVHHRKYYKDSAVVNKLTRNKQKTKK